MNWQLTAIATIAVFSFYNFLQKLVSSRINAVLALPFVAGGVFLASLLGLLFSRLLSQNNSLFTRQGATYAFLAGALWGVGQIFFLLMFSKGAPLSVGLPLVVGGLSVIGSILGIIILKEPVSFLKFFSIGLIVFGLVLLSRS